MSADVRERLGYPGQQALELEDDHDPALLPPVIERGTSLPADAGLISEEARSQRGGLSGLSLLFRFGRSPDGACSGLGLRVVHEPHPGHDHGEDHDPRHEQEGGHD